MQTLDVQGFKGAEDFDTLIEFCSELIERYAEDLPSDKFVKLVEPRLPAKHANSLSAELFEIYLGMKKAKDAGRDSIWKFILQNSYKPVFLRAYFDYVVGNPPWLTYADIANAGYQEVVKNLADEYNVTPVRVANMPHLELAAVFLAHSVNYFLKPAGVLAFVLPRSVLSADQHDNTRGGAVKGIRIREVWDLCDVSPLFRVPSSVAFVVRSPQKDKGVAIPGAGIPGMQVVGRLPLRQAHWEQVADRIEFRPVRWFYSQLIGARGRMKSALTTRAFRLSGRNAYAESFKQGATILPRTIYFVRPEGDITLADIADRIVPVRTDERALAEAKKPWINPFHGRVEGRFLFLTAIGMPMTLSLSWTIRPIGTRPGLCKKHIIYPRS